MTRATMVQRVRDALREEGIVRRRFEGPIINPQEGSFARLDWEPPGHEPPCYPQPPEWMAEHDELTQEGLARCEAILRSKGFTVRRTAACLIISEQKLKGDQVAETYWNGEPAACRRVMVRVADLDADTPPLAWWRGLEGTVRAAVEVVYGDMPPSYLDDDEVPEAVFEAHRAAAEADPHVRKLLEAGRAAGFRVERRGQAGDGWAKVTIGKGGPDWGHRSLPVAEVLGPRGEP